MEIRRNKSLKPKKKKEVLPSFLEKLTEVPGDVLIPSRKKKNASYLGPIFFGHCMQFHPPHHAVPLSSFHHIQFSAPSKENLLKGLFLPKTEVIKKQSKIKPFRPIIKKQEKFVDLYPHKCPGVKKVFVPDPWISESLGETKSVIEGETSREILFCRLRSVPFDCFDEEPKSIVEIVTLSDLREEKRNCMSYNERIAHAHFPKEFVTLRIIGPTIPESITITKIPSRREKSYEVDDNSDAEKTDGKGEETKAENSKEEIEEEFEKSEVNILSQQESTIEEMTDTVSETEETTEIEQKDISSESRIPSEVAEGVEEDETQAEVDEEAEVLEEEGDEIVKGKEKSVMFTEEENKSSLEVIEEEAAPES